MCCIGSISYVNVSSIVNGDFNGVKSFLIFSNKLVHVDVLVNVDNYCNFMITIFNQNLRVTAMLIRVKIFEFLILISVLNVIKYFNHSKVYDGIKIL